MSKSSKRFIAAKAKINRDRVYPLPEALKLLKETANVKFDSSVEVHVKLGIDPKKGDQVVRATVVLPHGTGKTVKVAAFVTPEKEKEARSAGADLVGGKELIEKIKNDGRCDFAVAVAEPAIMRDLSAIAKILGQKGLMPNPKTGTVTPNVKKVIEELKQGRINFKNDDSGNLHVMVGKVSFTEEQLQKNIATLLEAVKKAKPESLKGSYFKSITLTSSMGPGIKIAA